MLSLIGDIYDTTFDRALWNDTLKRLTDYAGAQSCGLVTQSATEGLLVSHNVGCDPQYLQTYVDQYWQFDPTQAIRLCDVGRIHRTEDWISFEDIRTWRNGWSTSITADAQLSDTTHSYSGKGVVRYSW